MSDAILLRGGGEKPIHMWKKYEVNTTTTYTWNRWNLVSTTIYKWNKWNTVTKLELQSGGSGNVIYGLDKVDWADEWIIFTYYTSKSATRYNGTTCVLLTGRTDTSSWSDAIGNLIFDGYIDSTMTGVYANKACVVSSYDPYNANHLRVYYNTSYTAYSGTGQGSTSYGQVTSTSPSAYPSNGQSGSYWYVSAGSEVQYSKGSTQYSDVSSTSSSAYPDNGHDESYWYDNKQTVVNHSMGNYIEDVFSLAQDTYPANGIAGSYWYVYQGQL